jgi:zinc/manganese transport system ATP-binding protein
LSAAQAVRPAPLAVAEAAVSFDHVTLALGERVVLDDVSLALDAGAFVGLLGPNGSGKTTLLRGLLGLVAPRSGRISVLGGPARTGRAGIGYLPQSRVRGIPLELCGRDFVAAAAGGTRWGLPIPSRAERAAADRAIEWVGAAPLARRKIAELSGGERQRLLLALALLDRPRLLLLDEPLVGLDPPAQAQIVSLVRRLQAELGCTVLCSSHELNPLLPALDLVLYLANRHAAVGTVGEVITGQVLSRLYGARVEVVRAAGRVFVVQPEAGVLG